MGTVLLDTFVGANGTAIAGHTPNVGGPWTSEDAGWQIQSNHLVLADASGKARADVGQKITRCLCVIDPNGMDAAAIISAGLESQSGYNAAVFLYYGDGKIEISTGNDDNSVYWDNVSGGFDPLTGNVSFLMQASPSMIRFSINGQVAAIMPRVYPSSSAFRSVNLYGTKPSGASGIVRSIQVWN